MKNPNQRHLQKDSLCRLGVEKADVMG